MPKILDSLYNMRLLEQLALIKTPIHRIHPIVKILVTLVYITVITTFDRYEIIRMLPFVLYPLMIMIIAEIPFTLVLKRLLITAPFVIGIGILNPLFDNEPVFITGIAVSRGWITFTSIAVKFMLTITASFLLIATTKMDKLAYSLRKLKVPKMFVLQLLLAYRYIYVLTEEVARTLRAYFIRAGKQKGIHYNVWGSLVGIIMLRTFGRGQRVYQAMSLRGFNGEYATGNIYKSRIGDILYLICWSVFFIIVRVYNLPNLIGTLIIGVV